MGNDLEWYTFHYHSWYTFTLPVTPYHLPGGPALLCDEMGLIGKEMFAIDGCKLPSNAAKEWSGTRADFKKKAAKMEKAIESMVKNHHVSDRLWNSERTEIREVAYFHGRTEKAKDSCIEKMKRKIDSTVGRAMYAMRLAIAEPPFAHICRVMGLDRFTLRGRNKVNSQWNLFCVVHNLKKIHHYGEGFA